VSGPGTRRLLLHPDVDRAAVDRAAARHGWALVNVYPRRSGRPRQVVFATRDGEALITFVEDHRVDARYLVIGAHVPDGPLAEARASLPTLALDQVLAMLPRDRVRALCWLGIAGPERAVAPVVEAIAAAADDPDPRVRDAAAFARDALGWPELRPAPDAEAPGAHAGPPAPEGRGAATGEPPGPSVPGLPERPRLASAVHARRHVVNGEEKIVLRDTRNELVAEIEPASWRALTLADGTRDLDALALACADAGVLASEADLTALLSELNAAGLLADGVELPAPALPVARPQTPPERPLEPLEGFTLVCDGSGSCCRFYGSVTFDRLEAARARLTAEGLRLPLAPEDAFTPVQGAQLAADDVRAVALVDGRCLFLEDDGRCGLHRRGGPGAKPFPCRFYPAMLMDDGAAVRVSLGPECACIFASRGRRDGEPLVPADARVVGDLGDRVRVMTLPEPVPLTATATAPREALRAWSARLVARLPDAEGDAVALTLALARAVEREGLALEALEAVLRAPPASPPEPLDDWLGALRARARVVVTTAESWRSASDLSRRVARWIADALDAAEPAALHAEAPRPEDERFYLRALAHGHRLALEGRPLAHGLRDRATRLLAARAMARVERPDGARGRHPLALLEAAMRNLGLASYRDRVRVRR
jgi:lysine-N-methylase